MPAWQRRKPTPNEGIQAGVWGRMASCAAIDNRRAGRLSIGPQTASLPHIRGVFMNFGGPEAHEDRLKPALRCTLDIDAAFRTRHSSNARRARVRHARRMGKAR